jgi:hypothetical protein
LYIYFILLLDKQKEKQRNKKTTINSSKRKI